jgi:DNA-binding CsgD family transcriptional regulator
VVAATDALELALQLARVREMGAFIDQTMAALEQALAGSFVSFNRLDFVEQTAMVTFRPYEPGREVAIGEVSRLLDEHPLYRWYTSQPDWSPMRISDVMPWEQFRKTRLLREVLAPVGGQHGILVLVTPPAREGEWVWFMASRADPDVTDDERAFCVQLQPALIALYETLSLPPGSTEAVVLTRRELDVLRYLAAGLTAETIARRLSVAPATVRKHLQNLYAKLGTSDRLGAVVRARDLGLLHADELSREFTWEIRSDLREFLFRPE